MLECSPLLLAWMCDHRDLEDLYALIVASIYTLSIELPSWLRSWKEMSFGNILFGGIAKQAVRLKEKVFLSIDATLYQRMKSGISISDRMSARLEDRLVVSLCMSGDSRLDAISPPTLACQGAGLT